MSVGNLTPRRDFTDVRDVVRAYRLAAIKGSGVYNVAQGRSIPVEAILTTLIRVAGVSVDVQMDPARARPSEVPEIVGSARKAADELGWHPEIALEQSLRDILSWWENQL